MRRKHGVLESLDRHLGYILVIPALLLIAVFSIYPIIQSLRFSFFDYQVNDPQKNGMFFGRRFNVEIMDEKIEFIEYYYMYEIVDVLANDDANQEFIEDIETFVEKMKEDFRVFLNQYEEEAKIVSLDRDQYDEIQTLFQYIETETERINEHLDGEEFEFSVNAIGDIVKSIDDTIISNNFVGLDNYKKALTDKRLWNATKTTLIFTVISVFFELILGLMLAMIMNKAMRGRGMVRTISLIPWAIPTSVAALMWRYLYDGQVGFIAHLLEQIHVVDHSAMILTRAFPSLLAVIFADIWKTTPYMALMLLAGLQTIPHDLYESSSIDGANRWQQFTRITLPLLKPSILVALLFRTLDAFRVHDLIQVLTNGGPGTATESLSIYSYKIMRSQTNYGYGATIVLFMAVMVGIISFIYIKVLGAKVKED